MRSTRRTVDVGRRARRHLAAGLGLVAALLVPAVVAAHPLGNFTINHYAGVRIEPDRILLDIVIDQAEIPTFQARLDFDTDGDGEVSDGETEAGRATACEGIRPALTLTVDDAPQTLGLTEAGLRFPPGVGGLSTMRIVCGFSARLDQPLAAGSRITFADTSFVDRLGWREIVVQGSGVTVAAVEGKLRTTTPSDRLMVYPTNLLTQALADGSVTIMATPGGVTLAYRKRMIDSPSYTLNHEEIEKALEEGLAFARRLRTGQVDVNGGDFNVAAPFGGYKQSGNGRELGRIGLEEFYETKAIQLSE